MCEWWVRIVINVTAPQLKIGWRISEANVAGKGNEWIGLEENGGIQQLDFVSLSIEMFSHQILLITLLAQLFLTISYK